MAEQHAHNDAHEGHHEPEGTVFQRIWVPFFILFGITVLEFAIAFTPAIPKMIKNPAYMFLTVLKAFYIIAYFMHLKFERMTLIYTIVLPFIFLIYLIVLLMLESGHIYEYVYEIPKAIR